MDESQRDEILYRLDERTERMDSRIERVDLRQEESAQKIDILEDRVGRNTTVLAGITFGLASFITAVVAKISSVFKIL